MLRKAITYLLLVASTVGMVMYPAIAGAGDVFYQRYVYYRCGVPYYSYKPVYQNSEPVSSNSYDYSSTYNYTYYYNSNEYPAAQGTTVWGMSQVGDTYEQANIGAALYAAQRFNEHALEVAKEGHAAASKLLDQNYKIAELQARRDIVIAALQGLSEPQNVTVYNQQTVNTAKAATDELGWSALAAVVGSKCIDCHNSTNKKGGLDLSNLKLLSNDKKRGVLARIKTEDPGKLMPKGGPRLNDSEIQLFDMVLGEGISTTQK